MATAETKKQTRKEDKGDRTNLPVECIQKMIKNIGGRIEADTNAEQKLSPREFSALCNSAEKLGKLLQQRDRDRFAEKRSKEEREKKKFSLLS